MVCLTIVVIVIKDGFVALLSSLRRLDGAMSTKASRVSGFVWTQAAPEHLADV